MSNWNGTISQLRNVLTKSLTIIVTGWEAECQTLSSTVLMENAYANVLLLQPELHSPWARTPPLQARLEGHAGQKRGLQAHY